MSAIRITSPFDGADYCAICVRLQMINFRNKIKEQWNRFNKDGKSGIVEIPFQLDPNLLWEEPITCEAGTLLCLTHFFNMVNSQVEAASPVPTTPKLAVAQGSLDSFRRSN
jgi:hypothetical protein